MPTSGSTALAITPATDAAPLLFCEQDSPLTKVKTEIADAAKFFLTPALILGERGTGKDLVARSIHMQSPIRNNPFVPVNCAALNPNLAESAFFGHAKGAFTGATDHHPGLFEQAQGGTLFFDEVGDLDLKLQAQLLRALNEGYKHEITPVGGKKTFTAPARIIAATNKNLTEEVRAGRFREDLLDRLKMGKIVHVPPLRQRKQDIPGLAKQLMEGIAQEYVTMYEAFGGITIVVPEIHPDAAQLLENHRWPGNTRELKGIISKAMLKAQNVSPNQTAVITANHVKEAIAEWEIDNLSASLGQHTHEEQQRRVTITAPASPEESDIMKIKGKMLDICRGDAATDARLAAHLDTSVSSFSRFRIKKDLSLDVILGLVRRSNDLGKDQEFWEQLVALARESLRKGIVHTSRISRSGDQEGEVLPK